MNPDLPPGVGKPKVWLLAGGFSSNCSWLCQGSEILLIGEGPDEAYRAWLDAAWRQYWIRLDQRVREATS